MKESGKGLRREHVDVHPDKRDHGEDGERANDNARGAFGPVGFRKGLLNEGEFRIGMFGVGLRRVGAKTGFLFGG